MVSKSRNSAKEGSASGGSRLIPVGMLASRTRGARSALDPTMSVMRGAAAEAQRSQLPQMAAALAYRTIFGLIPAMVIALVLIKVYTTQDEMAAAVRRAMDFAGLSQITIREPDPGDFVGPWVPGREPEHAAPLLGGAEHSGAAGQSEPGSLNEWIETLVKRVSAVSFRAIGVVGVAALIYAALSMLVEVERSFNQVYRVPIGRSWTRRIMMYWTLLTLGTAALAMTFYLGARFREWVEPIAVGRGLIASGGLAIGVIGFGITVLVSTGLFLLMYLAVPNTKVKVLPALVGAFTGAVLWEAGKWGFTQYLIMSGSTAFGRLYGSIALIPLFLMWVYLTWMVVLFGLQVSYYIQHGRPKTRAQPLIDLPPAMVDPSAALAVLAEVGRGFSSGEPVSAPQIVKATHLHEGVVRVVLSRLCERGLLLRVDLGQTQDAEPTYSLARPPQGVRVADVLTLGFELAAGSLDSGEQSAADAIAARLREAQVRAAGEDTLADVVPASAWRGGSPAQRAVAGIGEGGANLNGLGAGPTATVVPSGKEGAPKSA